MRKMLIVGLILIGAHSARAQEKNEGRLAWLDSALNTVTDITRAAYLLQVLQLSDTAWRYNYYHFAGPLFRLETFKDEAGEIPHGFFAWYNSMGYIDSMGSVAEGRKHGDWYYLNGEDMAITITKQYESGRLQKTIDHSQKKEAPPEAGEDCTEARFKGASFKRFIEANLVYPQRAMKMQTGSVVVVNFTIDETGAVTDVYLGRSVEYALDAEALRVIQHAQGKWKPGKCNGRPVKTYHLQPITFALEGE